MKHSTSPEFRIPVFFLSGLAGILPVSQCGHGNCASCFACAGAGILAICLGLWKKFQRSGEDSDADRNNECGSIQPSEPFS